MAISSELLLSTTNCVKTGGPAEDQTDVNTTNMWRNGCFDQAAGKKSRGCGNSRCVKEMAGRLDAADACLNARGVS